MPLEQCPLREHQPAILPSALMLNTLREDLKELQQ